MAHQFKCHRHRAGLLALLLLAAASVVTAVLDDTGPAASASSWRRRPSSLPGTAAAPLGDNITATQKGEWQKLSWPLALGPQVLQQRGGVAILKLREMGALEVGRWSASEAPSRLPLPGSKFAVPAPCLHLSS